MLRQFVLPHGKCRLGFCGSSFAAWEAETGSQRQFILPVANTCIKRLVGAV